MSYRAGEDERDVRVAADDITLEGTLLMPPQAQGMVLFAHGSGSSRHSPRNRFVAEQLREGALGSLLLDLLTVEEEAIDERTLHLRFDIGLLADRLIHAIEWLGRQPETSGLPPIRSPAATVIVWSLPARRPASAAPSRAAPPSTSCLRSPASK